MPPTASHTTFRFLIPIHLLSKVVKWTYSCTLEVGHMLFSYETYVFAFLPHC